MTKTALTRDQMREVITRYFEGCNEANVEKIRECFAPEAVHYFPAGAPQGPFVGAGAIANGWRDAVDRLGSTWTIDRWAIDEESGEAVIEWTHFKRKQGIILRGDEWYEFSERGLIEEIRAYYASPQDPSLRALELGGFDYAARGYPMKAP